MPLYHYRCRRCGREFDRRQSFSDTPLTACELPEGNGTRACGGEVRRVMHSVPTGFVGEGFYRNDSRRGTTAQTDDSGDKH